MANKVKSRIEVVESQVKTSPVEPDTPAPDKPDVQVDARTGKVETVKLDRHVSADSDLAVQIPPEADGTSDNTLGVLGEPSPEEVFASIAAKPAKS